MSGVVRWVSRGVLLGAVTACTLTSDPGDTDEDGDGASAVWDCDDHDPMVGARYEDADCDRVLTADDCNDHDAAVGAKGDGASCDVVVSDDLCDPNDPNGTTHATDADCDGVVTAEDCDDDDPNSATRATDADCDGVPDAADCGPDDPNLPPADDLDCDGVPSAQDCDDGDDGVGACPKGLEVVKVTQVVNGNDLDITCPGNKLVVGGGFASSGGLPFFDGMIPSGDGRHWVVKSTVSGTLTAYAVCVNADALPGYQVLAQSYTIERTLDGESNTLSCPQGKTLLGGGTVVPAAARSSRMAPSAIPSTNPVSFTVDTVNETFQNKTQDIRIVCADVAFTVKAVGTAGTVFCPTGPSGMGRVLSAGAQWPGNLWSAAINDAGDGTSTTSSAGGPPIASALCWE